MDAKTTFELDYWRQVRTGHEARYRAILEHWGVSSADAVLEIGTGPLGGVLPYIEAKRKVGLDPLYPQYAMAGELKGYEDVQYISRSVETFDCSEQFDLIVSMNALDHGDCDFAAIDRIAKMLTNGGLFCLHVHLRRPDQLNVGHDHALSERQLDEAIERNGFKQIRREVFDVDPIEGCAYKTVIGVWRK